jgi:hypothetical protein
MSNLADSALAYARNGWRVLPLEPRAKKPLIANWQVDASRDPSIISEWWANTPDANIGLQLDGLSVLDADIRHGGLESLADLEKEFGALDARARQQSGSGGWHYLFRAVEGVNTARAFRPGLDFLSGAGAQIVIAPSLHPGGGAYEWADEPHPLSSARDTIALAPPPQWLLDAVVLRKPKAVTRNTRLNHAERVATGRVLELAIEKVRGGAGRNDTGLWLFTQLRDNGYSRDEASLTVREWVTAANAVAPGQDRYTIGEAQASLRSAYTRASREPWDTDGKESQADILLALAEDFEHFKSGPANEGYVRAAIGDHNEVWPAGNGKGVPSSKVREILTHRYLEKYDRAPSRDALNAVGDTVLAKCGAGPKVEVHVRFARTRDAIYLDMCDDKWRVIEITAAGWRVVDKPSVLFRRPSGARALPVPVAGGSLEALRPLLNCGDDTQWCLMIAWLAGAFLPEGAFSHLVLEGGQGSAKSTTARVLQSMLDPSDAGLTAPPKDETDATVSALHAGILAYDNLSGCRAEMSDLFCRFSTGQGYRSRTLYSNLDSTVASVRLPIILNGIDATVMRGDLLERCITLKLPAIDKAKRLTEQGIWSDFAGIHAGVLGALLNVVSCGLRNLPHTTLADAPRMSDFCTWITACEPALPWMTGKFLTAYTQTMESANRDLADNDPVASALLDWADKCVRPGTAMETTASDLLVRLNELTRESPKDLRHWPPDAQSLAYRLVRLAPVLKAQGIEVRRLRRTMKARSRWEIWRPGPQGVIPQFIEDASPVEDEAA